MGITPVDQDVQVHVNYNDPKVLYLPPTYWQDSVSGGNTGIKVSYDIDAYLLFNFTGSHIWYYGDLNSDHGNCSFAIDDNTPAVFTTYSPGFKPVQLLWEQDVTPGPHVLKITNLEDKKPVTVASLIYRPLATATDSKPPIPTAAIAGLAVGLAIAVLCCVGVLVVLLRRRGWKHNTGSPATSYADGTVTHYQAPSHTYQSLAHSPVSIAPPTYDDTQGTPLFSAVAVPMGDIGPMRRATLVKSSAVLQRDAKGGR